MVHFVTFHHCLKGPGSFGRGLLQQKWTSISAVAVVEAVKKKVENVHLAFLEQPAPNRIMSLLATHQSPQ